jgi:hypothetical protein
MQLPASRSALLGAALVDRPTGAVLCACWWRRNRCLLPFPGRQQLALVAFQRIRQSISHSNISQLVLHAKSMCEVTAAAHYMDAVVLMQARVGGGARPACLCITCIR